MNVLAQQEDHPQGLLQYARLAGERQQWADVVRVVLRLMVIMPQEEEVKALLATALQVAAHCLQQAMDVSLSVHGLQQGNWCEACKSGVAEV